ncbi:MAG: LysR family transcriptional regulator [Marinibacterium sp.]|nr:LysR family transcriptional regulator [Marinibacterium sp.]
MDDLTLLRLFVQVVDKESFSAVARATGTTPSAISRQMSRLEDSLGARLLQRTTRQQALTEAGEIYLRHARQIIEDTDAARRAVAQLGDEPSGVLRITAEADLAHALLSPMLPGFLARYPALRVQLHTSARMEDLIGRGIDVAVRVGHLDSSSLIARRLIMSRSMLVASPDFLRSHGTPQRPQDLQDLPCLSFRVGHERTVWRFRVGQEGVEVPVAGPVQAASLVLLRDAARSGVGVAMLPVWMLGEDLDAGRLCPVLPGAPLDPPATPINAVYPSGRFLPGKVRVFVDELALWAQTRFSAPA